MAAITLLLVMISCCQGDMYHQSSLHQSHSTLKKQKSPTKIKSSVVGQKNFEYNANYYSIMNTTHPYPTIDEGKGGGDWVFVSYHKTGSSTLVNLARALCLLGQRKLFTYSLRESPQTCPSPRGCCYVLRHLFNHDVGRWWNYIYENPKAINSRLVHMMRDPVGMVASGYVYHRDGDEKGWTDIRKCSYELCGFPDNDGFRGSNASATLKQLKHTEKYPARPWLEKYGCGASDTYFHCLNHLPVQQGLEAETRRAYEVMKTMIYVQHLITNINNVDAINNQTDRPNQRSNMIHNNPSRTMNTCIDSYKPALFNWSVAQLWSFLTASASVEGNVSHFQNLSPSLPQVIERANRFVFDGDQNSHTSKNKNLASSVSDWKANNVSKPLLLLNEQSLCRH